MTDQLAADRSVLEDYARRSKESAKKVEEARRLLEEAENVVEVEFLSYGESLAGMVRDHGAEIFTNPEYADIAKVIHELGRDADLREDEYVLPLGQTVTEALAAVVPARIYLGEHIYSFRVSVDREDMADPAILEKTATLIAQLHETFIATQRPAFLEVYVFGRIGSSARDIKSITVVAQSDGPGWRVNRVRHNGVETSPRVPRDKALSDIIAEFIAS